MKVSVPYGRGFLELDLPPGATVIEPRSPAPLSDERAALRAALRAPLESPPLRELVGSSDRVVIVTSDITRPLPAGRIIPAILEEVPQLSRENATVLVGTGSHRACTEGELAAMLGRELCRGLRCVNHDAFRPGALAAAGTLGDGTVVTLNREYLEADIRITLGFIEPHFFAGFSGGPKAVMPGIAGIDTIRRFHRPEMIDHPMADWGVLEENPVQAMAAASARLAPPDFSVNVTLDGGGRITGVFCGDVIASHRQGAAFAAAHSIYRCAAPFDAVVTSNSGYPLDQSLYQSVKGICAAASIVRDGGDVICIARCDDGIPAHGDFADLLAMRDTPEALLAMIREPHFSRMDQWQVQKLASVLVRARVHLTSGLPDEAVRAAHLVPADDPGETLASIMRHQPGASVALLRYGPMSIPRCDIINGGLL
ncbi:MAG: nickel-dependent lactate racemase [Spirochaetes bacterium]|nr:nickel-dependent lactate racemase [Spirochaetota bacterium]